MTTTRDLMEGGTVLIMRTRRHPSEFPPAKRNLRHLRPRLTCWDRLRRAMKRQRRLDREGKGQSHRARLGRR
jgi:hypothetical protein